MIFLRLKGGLGNQIFQVVYTLLKTSHQESVYVDMSNFGRQFDKDYAAGDFLVNQVLAKKFKKKYKFINIGYRLSSLFWKIGGKFKKFFLDDYFSDVRNFPCEIDYRDFFDLDCDYNEILIDEKSVLIHVRKGDYTNSVNSKIYFNCGVEYFATAVDLISKKIKDPKFFIMSNDNNWVRENFHFLQEYKILEISDPVLSFKVMSKFSNFILSNSTFSWWPAFLTKSSSVYVPHKWFLDDKKNINLYPDYWVKVES
jgi:hypothetical protein